MNSPIEHVSRCYKDVVEMNRAGFKVDTIAKALNITTLEVDGILKFDLEYHARKTKAPGKVTRATKAQIITAIEGALSFEPGALKDLGKVDRPTLLLLINRLWDDEFLS